LTATAPIYSRAYISVRNNLSIVYLGNYRFWNFMTSQKMTDLYDEVSKVQSRNVEHSKNQDMIILGKWIDTLQG